MAIRRNILRKDGSVLPVELKPGFMIGSTGESLVPENRLYFVFARDITGFKRSILDRGNWNRKKI